LIRLMEEIRIYIVNGTFEEKVSLLLDQWKNNANRQMVNE